MPPIKDTTAIAEKWARVTPTRDADYRAGVADPTINWQAATAASASSYAEGVTAAVTAGRFARGVAAAGNDKWRRKATEVGTGRWGPGVRAAQADFQEGFAPFAEVIKATNLPPRAPAGDPRNLERVAVMARALAERKRRA